MWHFEPAIINPTYRRYVRCCALPTFLSTVHEMTTSWDRHVHSSPLAGTTSVNVWSGAFAEMRRTRVLMTK